MMTPDHPTTTAQPKPHAADGTATFPPLALRPRWVELVLPSHAAPPYQGPHYVICAHLKGRTVATGQISLRSARVGLLGLGVEPAFQRQGLGRELLRRLLDLADRQLELARVRLEVLASNTGAIQLYQSVGFTPQDRATSSTALLMMERRRPPRP
jgi:ribosomal protein S18 acetylase RimI-like enzyme